MSNQPVPPDFYEHVAAVGRALASPERLRLLDLLAQGERSVEVLAAAADLPLRTASHHLQQLKAARLVACRKNGRFAFYSLADDSVGTFCAALRRFAHDRSAEMQAVVARVAHQRPADSLMTRTEAKEALDQGTATFVDVRPEEEFQALHVPRALSIPLPKLAKQAPSLPKSKRIVTYCRSAHCLLADNAVKLLSNLGFDARRLEDGILEWRDAGLPTATSASASS